MVAARHAALRELGTTGELEHVTFDCRDPPDVRAAALSSLGWPVRAGRSAPSGGALVTHIVDCLEFNWAEDIVDHGGEASALLLRSGRAPQPHLADASSDDWADDWAEVRRRRLQVQR